MRNLFIVALFAYFCGSIPFGYLLVRIFKGKDVRATGSGNIGATNVARTAPALGIATLLLDATKGFFPFWLTQRSGAFSSAPSINVGAALAVAALFPVLGHMFPVWLKFKGGKGVATAVGVYLALSPRAAGFWFFLRC